MFTRGKRPRASGADRMTPPLVVISAERGPSTGRPRKPESSGLPLRAADAIALRGAAGVEGTNESGAGRLSGSAVREGAGASEGGDPEAADGFGVASSGKRQSAHVSAATSGMAVTRVIRRGRLILGHRSRRAYSVVLDPWRAVCYTRSRPGCNTEVLRAAKLLPRSGMRTRRLRLWGQTERAKKSSRRGFHLRCASRAAGRIRGCATAQGLVSFGGLASPSQQISR